jgi:hypothetical protein
MDFANASLQIADLLQILHGRSPASFVLNVDAGLRELLGFTGSPPWVFIEGFWMTIHPVCHFERSEKSFLLPEHG